MFNLSKLSGLDVGNSEIKAAEVSAFSKKTSLKSFSILKNDHTAFKSGEILSPQKLSTLLKTVMQKKSKKINFGMSGSAVMVKKIRIPRIAHDLIPEQLRWEAEQYIPFDIDGVNLDYVLLEEEGKADTIELLLIAAQQSRLSQYLEAFHGSGLNPVLADVSSFALANIFLLNYPNLKNKTLGLIDAGAFFTHFVVLHKGEVIFCRDIPAGGSRYDEELATNLGVSESEAEQIKRSGQNMPDLALDTIQKTSKSYADQILGSVEFFDETTEGISISEFFVTGGASLTAGFVDQLAEALQKPVQYMDVLRNLKVNSKILKTCSEEDLQYKSAVALGLALRKAGKK